MRAPRALDDDCAQCRDAYFRARRMLAAVGADITVVKYFRRQLQQPRQSRSFLPRFRYFTRRLVAAEELGHHTATFISSLPLRGGAPKHRPHGIAFMPGVSRKRATLRCEVLMLFLDISPFYGPRRPGRNKTVTLSAVMGIITTSIIKMPSFMSLSMR